MNRAGTTCILSRSWMGEDKLQWMSLGKLPSELLKGDICPWYQHWTSAMSISMRGRSGPGRDKQRLSSTTGNDLQGSCTKYLGYLFKSFRERCKIRCYEWELCWMGKDVKTAPLIVAYLRTWWREYKQKWDRFVMSSSSDLERNSFAWRLIFLLFILLHI